jgi:hypothetical protein
MSRKYKFGEKGGAYFVSFTSLNWIDVFTRVTSSARNYDNDDQTMLENDIN